MPEENSEKLGEKNVLPEKAVLNTADAREARLVDGQKIAEVQDINPQKHSGSAGGDNPAKSLEVVGLDYIVSRNSKLTGKDISKIEARQTSITREELQKKANEGDGQARDLLSYLAEAEKLPPGAERAKAIALQQKNADRTFLRGEFASRKIHNTDIERGKLSDTAAELLTRSLDNPALAPIAGLRAHADKLPEGEEKDRLTKLAKEQAAEFVPEIATRYNQDGQSVELSVMGQVLPKSLQIGNPTEDQSSPEKFLENNPDGWISIGQKIAQLPFDEQIKVIGSGIIAGTEQYQQEQKQRAWGSLIGTVQGVSSVAENLARVADFGAALILNDKEGASRFGEGVGTSIGLTIVGGVQLFKAADKYLDDIGDAGDYSKPFRDVAAAGIYLNQEWSKKTPFEQERIKSKFVSELLADGVVGAAGIGAIKKATKVTEVLDVVAEEAKALQTATQPALKNAASHVSNFVDDIVQTGGDTGIAGLKMPIPKDARKLDDYALNGEVQGRDREICRST